MNRVILDNGGGTTIQTADWAHHYAGPREAASDWHAIEQGANPAAEWDGHEAEALDLYPTPAQVLGGGYRVATGTDLARLDAIDAHGWSNVAAFIDKLRTLRGGG